MNLHLGSMKYKPEIGREVLQMWLEAMYLLLTLELAAQDFKQLEKLSDLQGLALLQGQK